MFWSARPFVRIFFVFASGILLAYHLSFIQSQNSFLYLSLIILFFIISSYLWWKSKWRLRRANAVTTGLVIFFLGIFLTTIHYDRPVHSIATEGSFYKAEIVNDPVPSEHSLKAILLIESMTDSNSATLMDLKVMAYFQKDSLSKLLRYGDRITFYGKISEPDEPKNPGEFNYREFLVLNGIHYVVFIPEGKWKYLGSSIRNPFYSLAGKVRLYLLNSLKENGLGERNYAVAAAILLGYDNLMDPELEQNFVSAGAMHILCVSGLHVGVVYLVINFLLGFMRSNRFQIWFKAFLLLMFIWAYALLTGLSPSVQRASVMITIFIIGNALSRGRDSYNTLAASAVLMLVLNPLLIFNVGFQLSYSAVLGILIFYQPVYRLLYINNYILDKLWAVLVVSVSAQLGTFPLAAHYFHFFPTYFWLTNMIIFPLSFAIIAIGMLFISVSWLPLIPRFVGYGLSGVLFILNEAVEAVRLLPYSGMKNLYYPWVKVFLVYVLIISIFQVFFQKNIRYLLVAAMSILLLVSIWTFHNFNTLQQNKLVVYTINNHSAIDFIYGNEHICLTDSVLIEDTAKQNYHLTNSRIQWGLGDKYHPNNLSIDDTVINLMYDGEFGAFGEFTFVVVDGGKDYFSGEFVKQTVDAVIVSGRKWLDIESVNNCFNFGMLIIDSSVPNWKRKKLGTAAKELGIQYYDVNEAGVFEMNF